jgi:hypothetical protein
MTKPEPAWRQDPIFAPLSDRLGDNDDVLDAFDIRASSFFPHSTFDIRHSVVIRRWP